MVAISLKKSPLQRYSKKLTYVRSLQNIATELERINSPKLSTKQRYLYQSYIFHVVAGWQVFIEETAQEAHLLYQNNLTHRANVDFKQKLSRFNTPKTQNIDQLFQCAINIRSVSSVWLWDGFSNIEAKLHLALLLNIRHEIAHKMATRKSLTYHQNFDFMRFLFNLAALTHNRVFFDVVDHNAQSPYSQEALPYPELRPSQLK